MYLKWLLCSLSIIIHFLHTFKSLTPEQVLDLGVSY